MRPPYTRFSILPPLMSSFLVSPFRTPAIDSGPVLCRRLNGAFLSQIDCNILARRARSILIFPFSIFGVPTLWLIGLSRKSIFIASIVFMKCYVITIIFVTRKETAAASPCMAVVHLRILLSEMSTSNKLYNTAIRMMGVYSTRLRTGLCAQGNRIRDPACRRYPQCTPCESQSRPCLKSSRKGRSGKMRMLLSFAMSWATTDSTSSQRQAQLLSTTMMKMTRIPSCLFRLWQRQTTFRARVGRSICTSTSRSAG